MTTPAHSRRRSCRFSLWTLFVLVAAFAVWLSIYRVAPNVAFGLTFYVGLWVWVVRPMVLDAAKPR